MDAAYALRMLIEHGFDVPGELQPESRFGSATEICPNPHWWHSTDGDSTEVEVSDLIAGLVRGVQPELAVETGAAFGQTTAAIGHALAANQHGVLHAVEPDLYRAAIAEKRCEGLPVKIVRKGSLETRREGDPIQFLFCDSTIELRVPEFLHFRPRMPKGSIVVFHDSRKGHVLRDEIEERLVTTGLVKAVDFPTPRGLTVCEVI